MAVEIRKVSDKETLKKFVQFGIDFYKGHSVFVPPLFYDELTTLNWEKNPAFEHCDAAYFLAYRDDSIVGRIAAIINHKANEIWNEQHARFGFIDFVDDDEVVDALFMAAQKWSKERGMDKVHGPLGFTDFDQEGLLIDGFEYTPTMVARYYHPYYQRQIERLGFVKDNDWFEYHIQIPQKMPERYGTVAEIVKRRYGLKALRFKNKKEVEPYIHELFELINRTYRDLYGFVPLTPRQIDYYASMYLPMLRLDFLSMVIRESDNKLIGFGVALPSLSKALQKAKGHFLPTGWWHLYRALKGNDNKVLDLMLVGIDPEYQGKGVNAIIFNEFIPAAIDYGFEYAESNLELENNTKVQSLWEGLDARHVRTRRAYIKEI